MKEKENLKKIIASIIAVPLIAITFSMGFSLANTARYSSAQDFIAKNNSFKNFAIETISPRVESNIYYLDVYGKSTNFYDKEQYINFSYKITERQYDVLKNIYQAKYSIGENDKKIIEQTKSPIVMDEEILLIIKKRIPQIEYCKTELDGISKLYKSNKNSYFYLNLSVNNIPIKIKVETQCYDNAKSVYQDFFEEKFDTQIIENENIL